ncbi:MAG: ABC transporter ATP-binding protein [Actinomycetota bacterium]
MTNAILQVHDLRKIYSSRKRGPINAVDGLSFEVVKGELLGLLGPNGAGKTTTIKSICTLIHPTSGTIHVDGIDAVAHPRAAVQKMAAVLEGNRNIYWRLTTKENLELFAGLHGIASRKVRPLIDDLIERFHLGDKISAEARALSRGMQQKLAVACAFVKQTPILLLDEPTLGLDVETSHELREQLRQMAVDEGRTILLSSHDMDVVQAMCERVIIINAGKVVADDRVSNLLELFKARAYRFTLKHALASHFEIALKDRFPLIEVNGASLEVELADGAEIYELMDLLRSSGAEIEAIDRKDPNLEEVFLKVVRKSTEGAQ